MTRILFAFFAIVAIAGCGSESSLPQATGKGSIRMINGIPTSPEIGFLIEETALDGVAYKNNSAPENWDDLTYTFNFEIARPLQLDPERIASRSLDVVRDVEYTFVVRGSIAAATVDVWDIPEREFSGTETVFEMRVGHAGNLLGNIDVYLGPASGAPNLGNLVATLAPGEVSAPSDVEEDSYIVTITSAGNSADIVFQSAPIQILASQSALVTVFEGDANDTAPAAIRIFNQQGVVSALRDARSAPTARFVHATMELGTSDLYDDEALSNRIVSDLAFGDVTGDIEMGVGDIPITATAPGNIGAILLESTLTTISGSRSNYYFTVLADEPTGVSLAVDRRSIETIARLTFFHSASNHQLVDLYVVESGTSIEDALPRQVGLPYGAQTAAIGIAAGSYDVYITEAGTTTVLDGPISVEAALGDVLEAVLLDRVDPALVEFRLFPPL